MTDLALEKSRDQHDRIKPQKLSVKMETIMALWRYIVRYKNRPTYRSLLIYMNSDFYRKRYDIKYKGKFDRITVSSRISELVKDGHIQRYESEGIATTIDLVKPLQSILKLGKGVKIK